MSQDRIIEKIQKLLNLANKNSNLEEATAAAAKAQALMEKHRIKETMLQTGNTGIQEELLQEKGDAKNWKIYLIQTISKNNGCYVVVSANYSKDGLTSIVGLNKDTKNVIYLYKYFVNELTKLCVIDLLRYKSLHAVYPPSSYTNSFYVGAIDALGKRLKRAKELARNQCITQATTHEEKSAVETALSKLDNRVKEAEEWAGKSYQTKEDDVKLGKPSHSGYLAGRVAAKNINLTPNRPELK